MILQFVADVHGAHNRLKQHLDPDQPVFLLGDNLNLIDFHTLSGVAARVLTKTDIAQILMNLGVGGPKKALETANRLFFHHPERVKKAEVEIRKEYKILAEILPENALVTHGNVDYPQLLSEALGERYIDGAVKEINGVRIGMVGGTGSYPYSINLPGEHTDEAYAEKLWSIGKVDILCTHFPPAIDDLTWDTVAKRNEGGGTMVNDYIQQTKPKLHLYGHIHNPKLAQSTLGETTLLNVGGFRYHQRVHHIDLDDLRIL